ncbi:TPA: twin-arginine translocation signal domain-containing protein [Candidatus Poribacteria bacterium]|nr:twin-arginine translocation signal domain-containing protein [Candidatus Poribacteria bacterium]
MKRRSFLTTVAAAATTAVAPQALTRDWKTPVLVSGSRH